MNSDPSKLRHQHRQEEVLNSSNTHEVAREFSSVEEIIRHDRQGTTVPPIVAERLNDSIAHEPKPMKPWWKRWFGPTDS